MTLKIEGKLTRMDPGTTSRWWTRRVPVPIPAVIGALGLIVVLSAFLALRKTQSDVYTGPPAPPSASFVGTDTQTRGSWKGKYGASGYAIAGDRQRNSTFAEFGLPGANQSWRWVDDVEDARALQKTAGKRVGAAWYASAPLNLSVKLKDAKSHRLAVYFVDWDSVMRSENVDVIDGITGNVLDSRHLSGFSDGHYLVWNVTGDIVLRITPASTATNIVVSGLFLD